MLRRSLLFLVLVAIALGVAWFYVERQGSDEQPQRVADAPSETTRPSGESAETAPAPAPEVRVDAAIEAPAEAEASPDRTAAARAEADLDAASDEPGRIERRAGQEEASSVAGEEVVAKGDLRAPTPAESVAQRAEASAPSRAAVGKGEASVAASEDVAVAAASDARVEPGAAEVTHAPRPASSAIGAGSGERLPEQPEPRAEPAATEAETEPAPDETARPRERDQAALQPEKRIAPEPPATSAQAPGEAGRTEAPAEAALPKEEPAAEEATSARAAQADEAPRPWWRWLSPDGLRDALAAIIGGDEETARPERPPEETAVAEAVEPSEAADQPEGAPEEAETVETPSESLSLESIRRALAALVGGDEPPAPAAGPPEPAPEEEVARPAPPPDQEVVEPEPVKPTFDIVRINRDRTAISAGRAEPDADIEVVVGDRVIDRVQADRRGQWVSTPFEPLEPGDREMTVVARLEDGARIESEQVVVVAVPEPPPPQPPAVAACCRRRAGSATTASWH